MVQIKQLTLEQFEERIALTQFAFQMEMSTEGIEEARASFRPDLEWGVFDEQGRLQSMLTIYPFEVWIQGQAISMGGIASVASWPDSRRQGGVSKLMIHALATMRENGQTISMLAPFSFSFYRKYGYEMVVERKAYTMETAHIPPRVDVPGHVRLVEKRTELFSGIYEAYASQYSGMLKRDDNWWKRKIWSKSGSAAIYYGESGEAEGYVIYQVTNRTFTVHEWVELTDAARMALWSFAANHDSMIDKLTLTASMDDSLSFLVPNPRFKQEVVPYFMSRIVDVTSFVEMYPFSPSNQEEALLLKLSDVHAPWNDGVFRMEFSAKGSARLERMNGTGASLPAVQCDIGTLTALLAGNRRPDMLRRVGGLHGDAAAMELLERRIPNRHTHLMDFF
ncbi:GNAT family acetyltransferase [Paenibacillus baekrokdamisoli]|uniref:GNAT family acetyltransferase n=1 Tax=Paenibacillus baekrokdamisoli TaxID=1712516 RepID=A0A3G9JKL1_9BACL|nr:GNAT family N-acetyltransferase [Paenibacillus baekrokdamisoli]MBB3068621.1 putative acetyltransferase [Paenibacillus baekrokdamisoli]BBH23454.1 GNAT family acetyltransferase [Paenibacillus baekrokdamisoli]